MSTHEAASFSSFALKADRMLHRSCQEDFCDMMPQVGIVRQCHACSSSGRLENALYFVYTSRQYVDAYAVSPRARIL